MKNKIIVFVVGVAVLCLIKLFSEYEDIDGQPRSNKNYYCHQRQDRMWRIGSGGFFKKRPL